MLVVAWRVRSAPQVAAVAIVTALLTFVAILAPHVPRLDAVREMRAQYASSHFPWEVAERVLQGQLSPVVRDWLTPAPGALDIPLGTLLAPFAIPRHAMRQWGDV